MPNSPLCCRLETVIRLGTAVILVLVVDLITLQQMMCTFQLQFLYTQWCVKKRGLRITYSLNSGLPTLTHMA